MAKREDLTKGTLVQLNCGYEHSNRQAWRNREILNGSYATVVQFHREVRDAIKISYKYKGGNEFSHIHYKDLDVIDEIPVIDKHDPVLFNEINLDTEL